MNYTADAAKITSFLEKGINEYGNFYTQRDSETLVIHSSIELIAKYGTQNKLTLLSAKENSNIKVSIKELKEWKESKETIEAKIREREKLHNQWVARDWQVIKKKGDKNYVKTSNAQSYEEVIKAIDRYNWLDNKLHFAHLKKLHNLTIDILGRLAGFVALFERDFVMLDAKRINDKYKLESFVSFSDLSEKNLNSFSNLYDCDDVKFEKIIKRDGTKIDISEKLDLIDCIKAKREYFKNIFYKNKNAFGVRNYIAHFNYITKASNEKDILDLIKDTRELMWYDRKLKNAVTKSIIGIFEKYGMELKFKIDYTDHKVIVDYIRPRKIYHLGTKKGENEISTDMVSEEFCDMCKSLLEMKK